MSKIDHDARPGPLTHCQITGSNDLIEVIDLGHQPLCDALLTKAQLAEPETFYPLKLMFCPSSGLAQADYVVPGGFVYPAAYPYRAGISWPVVEAHREMAAELVRRFGAGLAVDVGCNDGTLLEMLRAQGCTVIGVEPTNIAQVATGEKQLGVIQQGFSEQLARSIEQICGVKAHLLTMTNVFAHMADLGEVMRGVCALLSRAGVFVTESHYLLDVLQRNQFDTIYHEHIRTYSLKAIRLLVEQYGLEVFDVERHARYGGNLRAFIGWKGARPVTAAVGELLATEEREGLHDPASWAAFRGRVLEQRDRLMTYLYAARAQGKRIAGVSCPGRCATLINFYGIGPDMVEYLGELPNSLKLGKYLPGRHIPVVDNRRIPKDQPDVLLLMAWHYGAEIAQRLRREGVRGELVAPLPAFRVVAERLLHAA